MTRAMSWLLCAWAGAGAIAKTPKPAARTTGASQRERVDAMAMGNSWVRPRRRARIDHARATVKRFLIFGRHRLHAQQSFRNPPERAARASAATAAGSSPPAATLRTRGSSGAHPTPASRAHAAGYGP